MNNTRASTLELCNHPMNYGFHCTMAKGHDAGERATRHDSCTWHVESLKDRGPGTYYRFHIQGRIVQGGDVKDEEFSWSVRDLDDVRFVLDNAHAR